MIDAQNPPLRRDRSRASSRRRPRVSVLGVIGDLFITAGVVALLYVAWQLWIGDFIYGAEQSAEAQTLSQQWQQDYESTPPTEQPQDEDNTDATELPVLAAPGDAEVFATMYVPRFGPDYGVQIAGGTTRARTLDPIGIGHYNGTAMPGETGNVALAAHRTTYGAPFNRIADLHVGDAIVVETPEGWFTYRFRTLEYVTPQAVDVLLPVPQEDGIEANGKYMTLTSCSPMYDLTERIVAYSVFESFTPRSEGAPASLSEGLI